MFFSLLFAADPQNYNIKEVLENSQHAIGPVLQQLSKQVAQDPVSFGFAESRRSRQQAQATTASSGQEVSMQQTLSALGDAFLLAQNMATQLNRQ